MPAPPYWVDVTGPAIPVEYEAPEMAHRLNLVSSVAQGKDPVPHQLTRWPGQSVQPPTFFNPKLRTNLFLKSYGYPSENITAHFERADTRAFWAHRLNMAVRIDTKSNRFGDQRAIPAVFVPTQAANTYSGPTQ